MDNEPSFQVTTNLLSFVLRITLTSHLNLIKPRKGLSLGSFFHKNTDYPKINKPSPPLQPDADIPKHPHANHLSQAQTQS